MKQFTSIIKEELDDNLFWLLDKWFYNKEQQLKEFKEIVSYYNDYKSNISSLEAYINNTVEFKDTLCGFINFIDNDITPNREKDYIQRLKDIIKAIIDNKSNKNKYIKYEEL